MIKRILGLVLLAALTLGWTHGVEAPPAPPGTFSVSLNLAGLEFAGGVNPNNTPSVAEMAYNVSKGITNFRIPMNWIYLQPFAFGPLNSSYLTYYSQVLANAASAGATVFFDFHNQGFGPGVNALLQTGLPSGAPWLTANCGSSNPTITSNAALDPLGNMTAFSMTMPAVSGAGACSFLAQPYTSVPYAGQPMTASVQCRGAVGGEQIYLFAIGTVPGSSVNNYDGEKRVTLTTSYQPISLSYTTSGTVNNYFLIGTDLRDTNQSATSAETIYCAFPQEQYGTTATAYQPVTTQYTGQALVTTAGTGGPTPAAFANAWLQLSRILRVDPNYARLSGLDPMNEWAGMGDCNGDTTCSDASSQALVLSANTAVMTALRNDGDVSLLHLEWDHYTGAWDAVTNNIYELFNLIKADPAHNSIAEVHDYHDHESCGCFFVWQTEVNTPGVSPPGINTNVNIGQQRTAAVVALAASMQVPLEVGETGVSNDLITNNPPGNDDYQDWNQTLSNYLTYLKANNVRVVYWAGGGFPISYALNTSPYSATDYTQKDFTSAGVQSTQMVVLEQFTGYAGAQPLAYSAQLPISGITYTPVGTPLPNFKIRYNGIIPSTVTFQCVDTLPNGSSAGGTCSPITLPPGNNGIATFSYTPGGTYPTINLTFTNNAGLTNPPTPLGVSSQQDFFQANLGGAYAPNIYALVQLNNSYVGPAVTLQRASDNAQQTFSFTNYSTPLSTIDRNAIQAWAGSDLINVVNIYSQFGGNTLSCAAVGAGGCGSGLYLNLYDASGYPSFQFAGPNNNGIFVGATPSNGQGLQTLYAYINPQNSNPIVTQDTCNGACTHTFRLLSFQYGTSEGVTSENLIATNSPSNSWTPITTTQSNLYGTNNLKSYSGNSLYAQASIPQFTNQTAQNLFNVGNFSQFNEQFKGNIRAVVLQYLEYSSANVTALNAFIAPFYATPLPAINPLIAGLVNQFTVSGTATQPFAATTISDANLPSPTDSVTITLSGYAATLTGSGLSGSYPTYTLASATPATITTELRALQFTSTGAAGSTTNINIAVTSSFGTSTNQSITDTITVPVSPTITAPVAPNVSMDQGAPALWQVVVNDGNPNPMVSASITVTGAAGTMSHIGPYAPSGTGPYTFSAMTPVQLTRALDDLIWTPSVTSVGTTTTFSLTVTNALSLTATASNTITNIAVASMPTPLTPVATPGTLPTNYNGLNFSGGENSPNPNYQTSSALWSWANTTGFDTIRLPFLFGTLNHSCPNNPAQFYANLCASGVASLRTGIELARANGQYVILDDHEYAQLQGNNPFFIGASFTGTSSGTNLTATAVHGTITTGQTLSGGATIISQTSGTSGGAGIYVTSTATTFSSTPNINATFDDSQSPFWGEDPRVPFSAFSDLWQRTTTLFAPYANVIYGIQNEPGVTGTQWYNLEIAGVTGIRAASHTVTYLISGNFSNVTQFDYTPFTGYADPFGGPWMFDVHMYFDNSGGSKNTCVSAPVTAYFGTFTSWLNTNGYKALVSEYAVGTDATCIPTLLNSIVAYFNTNSNVYPGWQWWGGGDFGTGYVFYMGPIGTPAQLQYLTPYLP